jgi:hypothetical protein
MDVEHHWLAGKAIDWRTGNPKNGPPPYPPTHSGAFVAAVCARARLPMLTGSAAQNLIPNRQQDWLLNEGAGRGWTVVNAVRAQRLANQGWVVIASWKNPAPPANSRTASGHGAIVRPDARATADISGRGPRITQAGQRNFRNTDVQTGFPRSAWEGKQIVYVAHRPTPAR